jgi:hypothetical protein
MLHFFGVKKARCPPGQRCIAMFCRISRRETPHLRLSHCSPRARLVSCLLPATIIGGIIHAPRDLLVILIEGRWLS